MMKKTMLYLLLLLSVLLLAACQKQPQPEIKLPEPQAAAKPAHPEPGAPPGCRRQRPARHSRSRRLQSRP